LRIRVSPWKTSKKIYGATFARKHGTEERKKQGEEI